MIDGIIQIISAGLKLWEHNSRRKYQEQIVELQEKYYEENKKERPDHAVLDDIEFRLFVLGRSFASEVEGSETKNK